MLQLIYFLSGKTNMVYFKFYALIANVFNKKIIYFYFISYPRVPFQKLFYEFPLNLIL